MTLVVIRHKDKMKEFYERLIKSGKAKIALIAKLFV
jgi:hypothetical protein